MKRGPTAHIVTRQVLFTLYQKAFLSTLENHSTLRIEELARNLRNACRSGNKEVSRASQQTVEGLRSLDITNKTEVFEQENSKNAEFQVFNCYLRMVMEMMASKGQSAKETGNFILHQVLFCV